MTKLVVDHYQIRNVSVGMKILYFTMGKLYVPESVGIMCSQVAELLSEIKDNNSELDMNWLAIVLMKEKVCEKINRDAICTALGNEVKFNQKFVGKNILRGILYFLKEIFFYRPDIVHCRSYFTTLIALLARFFIFGKYKIIFDTRGPLPEEMVMHGQLVSGSPKFKLFKFVEKFLLRHSDYCTAVSDSMMEYYKGIAGDNLRMGLIPCGCKNERFAMDEDVRTKIRKELGWEDNFIVVISGRLSAHVPYQNIADGIIKLYNTDKNIRFLILTRSDTTEMQKYLDGNIPLEAYKVFSLLPKEVPLYLCASDAALFLLSPLSYNSRFVLSVRLPEYLASGLRLIISDNFCQGIINNVQEYNAGIIIHDLDDINNSTLDNLKSIPRKNPLRMSREFSLTSVAQKYTELYFKLLDGEKCFNNSAEVSI